MALKAKTSADRHALERPGSRLQPTQHVVCDRLREAVGQRVLHLLDHCRGASDEFLKKRLGALPLAESPGRAVEVPTLDAPGLVVAVLPDQGHGPLERLC